MKMKIIGFDMDVDFSDSTDTILIIKDSKLFSKVAFEVYNYSLDSTCEIIILDDHGEIIKNNFIECIYDIISYDLTSKKVLAKIYMTIKNNILDDVDKENTLLNDINKVNGLFIEELENYNLDYSYETNIKIENYLKLLNLKIVSSGESVFNKMIDLIEIYSELFNEYVIIFINIMSYLNDDELKEVLKYKKYKKLKCIFIENGFTRNIIENTYIIDDDLYMYKL